MIWVMDRLASLWLTVVLLGLTALVLLVDRLAEVESVGWIVAVPLAALCLNLLAALVVNVRLRTQGGLLVFHLALAVIAALGAWGRLVAVSGHVEMTEGVAFSPAMAELRAGPLHDDPMAAVNFIQGQFTIAYAPGMKRRETVSTVLLPDGQGGWQERAVGDDAPLVIDGYRLYTTSNKGFAPLLTYVDDRGEARSGTVHFPSYPVLFEAQGNDWTLPDGSATTTLWLEIDQPVFDEENAWRFDTPKDPRLVLIVGERRVNLSPGDTVAVGNGKVRFEELRTWMGYEIFFDPTLAWILSASMVAVAGLAWHVAGKVMASPWDRTAPGREPAPARAAAPGLEGCDA